MDPAVFWVLLAAVKSGSAAVITAFGDQFSTDSFISSSLQPRAIRTSNPLYGPWLTPSAIPYRFSATMAAMDQTMVTNAMNAISTNMNSCIRFVPWTAGAGDFLQISSTFENGTTLTPTCFSFPGRVLRQAGNGQKLGMIGGVDGCLESIRSAMKYLVHALGLRNEYLRPDRTTVISVVPDSALKPAFQNLGLVNPYTTSNVVQLTSFDIKSVTIPAAAKFAATSPLYTVVNAAAGTVGDQAVLSVGDCIGLKSMYPSCLSVACIDPYNGQPGSVPQSAVTGVGQAPSLINTVATQAPVVGQPTVAPVTPVQPTLAPVTPVQPTVAPVTPVQPTLGPVTPVLPTVAPVVTVPPAPTRNPSCIPGDPFCV